MNVLKRIDKRFIKFLFVGGFNTLFGYAMYAGFIALGFHYTLASLCSTVLGTFFNFITTGTFVFNNKEGKLIYRFIAVYILIYLINVLLLKVLLWFGMNSYVSGALLLLPMAIISFLLNRTFVFRRDHETQSNRSNAVL
jgi:putative flippase GtrA